MKDCRYEEKWLPWGYCPKGMKAQCKCVQCGVVFHPLSWKPCDCNLNGVEP